MRSDELLFLTAGALATPALQVIANLNWKHPEISGRDLALDFQEIYDLFAMSDGRTKARDFIVDAFRPRAARIVSEASSLGRPRFMELSERTRLRRLKSRGFVTQRSLKKILSIGWFSAPRNLSGYSERSSFTEERDRAQKVSEMLANIGCSRLAASAANLKEELAEVHGNRPRLSIVNACLILAKMHGYEPCGHPPVLPEGKDMFIAAPLHDMGDLPRGVEDAVSGTELEFPLFDHHIALFPSCGDFGEDLCRVRRGLVVPVVLGERDESCYFISEWK